MHWGPGPHRLQALERWRAHHSTATHYGLLAVARNRIHSRQVGSAVAAARTQGGLLLSARAMPSRPQHGIIHFRGAASVLLVDISRTPQATLQTRHILGFGSLRLPQRRYSRINSVSLRSRLTTRTIIALKLAPASPPPPPPTLPPPLRSTTTRSRCHKSTPCPTTRYADISYSEPSDSLRSPCALPSEGPPPR